MKTSNIHKTTIIFDIAGVLVKENRLKILAQLGLADTLRYFITHRRNPVNLLFSVLSELSKNENKTTDDTTRIAYKGSLLPLCISQWQLGAITNAQLIEELKLAIENLHQHNFFASSFEKRMVEKMMHALVNTEQLKAVTYTIKSMPNMIHALKSKGYKLFIVSNQATETFAMLQATFTDLFNLFDGTVISSHVAMLKPELSIYQYLLTTYHLNAKDCIFIDDQEENLPPARSLGIDSIHFKNAAELKKQLKSYNVTF